MRYIIVLTLALIVGHYNASSAFSKNDEKIEYCNQWEGTPYELRHQGCVRLIGDRWVVGATYCEYAAYLTATMRDYFLENLSVVVTEADFNRTVGSYSCVLSPNGTWSQE
jgi:hypothetical protein